MAVQRVARIARLERDAVQMREWLAAHPSDRPGSNGAVRQSSQTDNERAKMAIGNGVIQGYTVVAAVDGTHQAILEAQLYATGSEEGLLLSVAQTIQPGLMPETCVTADVGYRREASLQVTARITDNDLRRGDERFATPDRHRAAPDPLHDKPRTEESRRSFSCETSRTMPPRERASAPPGRRCIARGATWSPTAVLPSSSACPSGMVRRARAVRNVFERPTLR